MIVHLNGMPGTGKLTVGRLLAAALGARLMNNHSIINQVGRGHPEYTAFIMRLAADVLAGGRPLVCTNSLVAELADDRARFSQIAAAGDPFVQVWLHCEPAVNLQRVTSSDRADLGKLTDPAALANLRARYTIYHPPAAHPLELDTTASTPAETCRFILDFLGSSGLRNRS